MKNMSPTDSGSCPNIALTPPRKKQETLSGTPLISMGVQHLPLNCLLAGEQARKTGK